MNEVTKSSFLRNRTFSAKNRFKMQSYLNEMSANGLHITEIRKHSCRFSEDASVRYIYSICGEYQDALYTSESRWEHFCNYKGVSFFRRAVPNDAVKHVRVYKRKHQKQERSWLSARLREGLLLMGKVGDEYVFERTEDAKNREYVIKNVGKTKKSKDGTVISPLGDTSGLTFICGNDDGSVCYFTKNVTAQNIVLQSRGRRISEQIFSIFAATGAVIGFAASALAIFYGLIVGGALMLPLCICGGICALIAAIIFTVYFRKFQKVGQARKIYKEEQRLMREAETKKSAAEIQKEERLPEQNNNTVVMNTVVMNNYGDKPPAPQPMGMGINSYGQIYDESMPQYAAPASPALDPRVNPAINTPQFAQTVIGNALGHPTADTLLQGDAAWQPQDSASAAPYAVPQPYYTQQPYAFPSVTPSPEIPPSSSYDDEDWVASDESLDSSSNDTEGNNKPFPFIQFILAALACFVSVIIMIFGLRYGIECLISFGKGNALTLLLSVMGTAFSPFIFRFGFVSCAEILKENAYETED